MLALMIALSAGFACLVWPNGVFDTPLAMLTLGMIGQLLLSIALFWLALLLWSLTGDEGRSIQDSTPLHFGDLFLAAVVFIASFCAVKALLEQIEFSGKLWTASFLIATVLTYGIVKLCDGRAEPQVESSPEDMPSNMPSRQLERPLGF